MIVLSILPIVVYTRHILCKTKMMMTFDSKAGIDKIYQEGGKSANMARNDYIKSMITGTFFEELRLNKNNNACKADITIPTVYLLDGDNIRGKTKFKVTKEQLLDDVIQWIEQVLFTIHDSRFTIHYSLFTIHYSLLY